VLPQALKHSKKKTITRGKKDKRVKVEGKRREGKVKRTGRMKGKTKKRASRREKTITRKGISSEKSSSAGSQKNSVRQDIP